MPNRGQFGFPSGDYIPNFTLAGGIFRLTPPPLADWSWINQGTAVLSTLGGFINIYAPAVSGTQLRAYLRTIPTKPYNIDAIVSIQTQAVNYCGAGMCWYDSIHGTFASIEIMESLKLRCGKWNSVTAFNGSYFSEQLILPVNNFLRVRLHDDISNRQLYYSVDSLNWVLYHTIATNDFLTPTHIGIYVNSSNGTYPVSMTLWSWAQS